MTVKTVQMLQKLSSSNRAVAIRPFLSTSQFKKIVDLILLLSTNRQNTGRGAFHEGENTLLDYFPRLHDILNPFKNHN